MKSRRTTWWGGVGVGFVLGVAVALLGVRRNLAGLAAYARRYTRREVPTENPVLIVNRWSGGGKAEDLGLADAARRAGAEVVMLERGDDLTQLAENAVSRGADALGMAGGDGSLGLVAAVAMQHDLPFFCVPMGTRNHFALDVGLDRDDPLAALKALTDGEEIRIDHGLVGGRVFLNNVSLGVYPKAVKKEDYRDKKVKSFVDSLSAGVKSGEERPDLHFQTPDGRTFETTPLMLVSNNEYTFSGPPDFARRRRLDEGVLGVGAMTGVPRDETETIHLKGRDFEAWTVRTYTVEARDGVVETGVDGETIDFPSPLEFEVRPGALRLLVPRGTKPGYVTTREEITAEILDLAQLGGDLEE